MNLQKRVQKNVRNERHRKRYYSFFTIVLLLCLLIVGYSVFLNICKIFSYHVKNIEMKKILAETTEKNESLKQQLEDLNSRSYEAIARNNLKMSGENEVLIIVREDEKTEAIKKNNKKNTKHKKNKKDDKSKQEKTKKE